MQKRGETFISLAVMTTLVIIAVFIFSVQFDWNPAVLTSETFIIRDQTASAGKESGKKGILNSIPGNIKPLTPPEFFHPATLSDKINGKAELYLSAGFLNLKSQRYSSAGKPELWFEVFLYDMGNVHNAFAVFSSQRRSDYKPLGITRFSYMTDNSIFFVHGRHYVEIIGSDDSAALNELNSEMAGRLISENPVTAEDIPELDLFPPTGLARDSITLLPANAFGFHLLDNTFIATYEIEGIEATAFLSRRSSTSEATNIANAYHKFLLKNGGIDEKIELDGNAAGLIEIMDYHEIIFTRGPFIAGVHETEDKSAAGMVAAMLYKRLSGIEDGN